MTVQCIHYRGSYEYANTYALERAIASARAELDDDDLAEVAWLRFFVCRGTSLTVNLTAPASSTHRFVAANMFLVLAHGAVDGSVEAICGSKTLDRFVAGSD